jgi:sugar/nucleoside kinase (ribokinase family)
LDVTPVERLSAMAFHTIDRDDERDVVFDGGGREGWSDLMSSLPDLVADGRPLVLDVSALTLLPAEVADLRRAIASLTGRDVRIACSRLSGRRLLRRLLPDEVAVVLASGVVTPTPADLAPA